MEFIHCKMGDVVSLEQGLAINKKSNHLIVQTGIPLLRITDMLNQNFNQFIDVEKVPQKFIARPNDLIFSRTGQVGYIFRNQKGVIHNNCFRIDPVEKINRGYLYWYLSQKKVREHVNAVAKGAAQPDLNHDAFKSLPFSYPENINAQSRIVEILDQYSSLIENNKRRIELLEESARQLYKEWFVRFRFPSHEHVKVVDGVPEGWEKCSVGDLLTLQRGFDLPVKKRIDGQIPIYASTGINGYHNEYKAKAPGIVTGRSGSLGTVLYVSKDFWPLNTALWVKEFKKADPFYTLFFLRSLKLENYNGGAAVPTLNRNDVHSIETFAPPEKLLESFSDYLKPIFRQIDGLSNQNSSLIKARDLLLPKLMSGEVAV